VIYNKLDKENLTMRKYCLVLILFTSLISACASYKKSPDVGNEMYLSDQGIQYMYMYCDKSKLNYLITFPKDYDPDIKKYPLIVYLHSMSERGTDLEKLIYNEDGQGHGIAKYAIENRINEFITISPLCPEGTYWTFLKKRINKLLINISSENSIDIDRIYLTGVSMGGMGTWSVAMDYPEWFAAFAPMSGGIYKPFMSDNIKDIQNIPIWIFHDKYDEEIPIEHTTEILRKLEEVNADVQVTIYEEGEHYINERVFDEGVLFDWFLNFKK